MKFIIILATALTGVSCSSGEFVSGSSKNSGPGPGTKLGSGDAEKDDNETLKQGNDFGTGTGIDQGKSSQDETPTLSEMSEDQIYELCKSSKTKSSSDIRVIFPAQTSNCNWGNDGNAGKGSTTPAARSEQVVKVNMPENAKIVCGASLATSSQSITYDDSLIITIDGFVVAANGFNSSRLEAQLEKNENGLFIYDFSKLVNRGYDRNQLLVLPNIDASIPVSEQGGLISLNISHDWFKDAGFFSKKTPSSELTFNAIVTGNEQSSDCKHTGLDFNLSVDYIE